MKNRKKISLKKQWTESILKDQEDSFVSHLKSQLDTIPDNSATKQKSHTSKPSRKNLWEENVWKD